MLFGPHTKYPRFFDVDDVPMKLDLDLNSSEPIVTNWAGLSRETMTPWKVVSDGREIDELTFNKAVGAYRDRFERRIINDDEFNGIISGLFGTKFYKDGAELPPKPIKQ